MLKRVLPLVAASLAAVVATGAAAADPQVSVSGIAEASCTLPSSWAVTNVSGGAAAGQFSGQTWTIPDAYFADTGSLAATGADIALRVRGTGVCNTSHSFRLESTRGGLVTGDPGTPAPAGFSRRRAVRYDAFWSNGSNGAQGPAVIYTPSVPGLSSTANYTVSGALPPPGVRQFDFRMLLNRGGAATPMVAGEYSDTIVITLTISS